MRKSVSLVLLILISISSLWICIAENKNIDLGDTGISFEIDSSYDIITNKNKKEYSKEIQNVLTRDNTILVIAQRYTALYITFDQGKDYEKYDFSSKKAKDIEKYYSEFLPDELKAVKDAVFSVYDSGETKWISVSIKSENALAYMTIQGSRFISALFNTTVFSSEETERVIDSFKFGSPSLWYRVKSIAKSITEFGRNLL